MPQDRWRVITAIIITLLLFYPDSTQVGYKVPQIDDDIVGTETRALDVLVTSSYGDFSPEHNRWLNVTGLRESDGFAWGALGAVKERAQEQVYASLGKENGDRALDDSKSRHDPLPVYRNVSGFVRGTWVRSRLETGLARPQLNLTAILPNTIHSNSRFRRNITGGHGEVYLRFVDKDLPDNVNGTFVRGLKAEITITDETSSGSGWSFVLYGERILDTGSMVLSTSSEKFAGLFAIPHLSLSQTQFSGYKSRLNRTIRDVIQLQKAHKYRSTNPWSSSIDDTLDNEFAAPNCEFIVYLQQHLVQHRLLNGASSTIGQSAVEELETDLRFPSGHTQMAAPQLVMSMLIFSPDCGFILESLGPPDYTPGEGLHLVGLKDEVHLGTARKHALLLAIIIFLQTYLLTRQMKESCTPSTLSRISIYPLGLFALADGFVAVVLFPLGVFNESVFPILLATSFLALGSTLFFSLRLIGDISFVQREDRRRLRRLQTSTSQVDSSISNEQTRLTPVPIITAAGVDTLPFPATTGPGLSIPPAAVLLGADQDEPFGSLTETNDAAPDEDSPRPPFGIYLFILFSLIFLSLHSTSWPTNLGTAYKNTLCFIYMSFWTPQIYRNTMRNCRKALRWEFVLGQSALRLVPVTYFYLYDQNVGLLKVDNRAGLCFIAWVWLQICVLVSQDILGPRVFVRKSWVPLAYDYHPILHEDEENTRVLLGSTSSASAPSSPTLSKFEKPPAGAAESKESKYTLVFDCAICMQRVEVPIVPNTSSSSQSVHSSGGAASTAGIGGSAFIWRRNYMITPCKHVFHKNCLEAAMRYRLQCPICREGLPPL